MNALTTDHDIHFAPVHAVLAHGRAYLGTLPSGTRYYYLRKAMRALAVAPAAQRYLERRITTSETFAWSLVFDGTRHCLLVDERAMVECCFHSNTEEAVAFGNWFCEVMAALRHHGHYNPATNHEPPPGKELDALELRERLNDGLRQVLPGLFDLPRYYIVDGQAIPAEEYHQQREQEDTDNE